jgi:hypothetical protein
MNWTPLSFSMETADLVNTIQRGIHCPIGLEAVWGKDKLTG